MSRLDCELFSRGLCSSREKARRAVLAGNVLVNGEHCDKPAREVGGDDTLALTEPDIYVGRGALKLEHALRLFGVDPAGRICLDVGASTGGFTQVLLLHGAAKVFAADVGSGQLASELRSDARVVNLEKTDIRSLSPATLGCVPSLCTVDVSFIPLSHVLPAALALTSGDLLVLVKPQFEAGRAGVGKKGVVRDKAVLARVLREFHLTAGALGLRVKGLAESPVKGGDGNTEYLAHLVRAAETD